MKRNAFLTLAALCPVALFVAAGCSSSGVNPNITVYDRDTVADRDVSLPGNYGTENYRRLTLATMPGSLISNSFSDSTMKSMSLRMQSELAKIKRFSVYAVHGADETELRELEDIGELKVVDPDNLATIDLLASWNVTLNAEVADDALKAIATSVIGYSEEDAVAKFIRENLDRYTG